MSSHYARITNCCVWIARKTIEKLEAERNELLEQIAVVDSKINQAKDQRTCEDLANLADNKDWLQQQIAQEKAKHVELDVKVTMNKTSTDELQIFSLPYWVTVWRKFLRWLILQNSIVFIKKC